MFFTYNCILEVLIVFHTFCRYECVCTLMGAQLFHSCPPFVTLYSNLPGHCPWNSSGKNTWSCHAGLQGIFPTQGSRLLGFLHWRWFFTTSATWEVLFQHARGCSPWRPAVDMKVHLLQWIVLSIII